MNWIWILMRLSETFLMNFILKDNSRGFKMETKAKSWITSYEKKIQIFFWGNKKLTFKLCWTSKSLWKLCKNKIKFIEFPDGRPLIKNIDKENFSFIFFNFSPSFYFLVRIKSFPLHLRATVVGLIPHLII